MDERQIKTILYTVANYSNYHGTIDGHYVQLAQTSAERIQEWLNDNDFYDVLIHNVPSNIFHIIVKNFNIDKQIINKRNFVEKNIIKNYSNHDINLLKQCLFSLIFHNTENNTVLDIKTIEERANLLPSFKTQIGEFSSIINIVKQINSLDENSNNKKINAVVQEALNIYNQYNNSTPLHVLTKQVFDHARQGFKAELEETLQVSKEKIFGGLEPQTVITKGGNNVLFYQIDKSKLQADDFAVLIHTSTKRDYYTEHNAMQNYKQGLEESGARSCFSLVNGNLSISNSFAQNNRIIFGHFTIDNTSLLCANTSDGQTSQFPAMEDKYNYMQQFLPIKTFIAGTRTYNEIVLLNHQNALPECIVTTTNPPDDYTIEVSSKFKLPILYIDEKSYEGEKTETYKTSREMYDRFAGKTSQLSTNLQSSQPTL